MASSSLAAARLVEFFLHVRLDRAVRRRVRDAREHEAVTHLVVVQERLVGLVDGTSLRARPVSSVFVIHERPIVDSGLVESPSRSVRVTSTYRNLTRARRARARAARVRQVDAGFLRASQKQSPLRQSRALADARLRSRATRPTRRSRRSPDRSIAAPRRRRATRFAPVRARATPRATSARVATRRTKIRSTTSHAPRRRRGCTCRPRTRSPAPPPGFRA